MQPIDRGGIEYFLRRVENRTTTLTIVPGRRRNYTGNLNAALDFFVLPFLRGGHKKN
jgi:hypothetical protein